MKQEILNQVIEITLSLVALIVTGVIVPQVSNWIKTKTKSSQMQSAVTELAQAVNTAVSYVEQTIVRQLKADGKWDTESQEQALKEAQKVVLSNLSNQAVEFLRANVDCLEDMIVNYIESEINYKKSST